METCRWLDGRGMSYLNLRPFRGAFGERIFYLLKLLKMKKTTIYSTLLTMFFGLIYSFGFSQGIIVPGTNKLKTVNNVGATDPAGPKFGISVANPDANLDVEGLPDAVQTISNVRLRNLPTAMDSMVLVHDVNGYVRSRPFSSFLSNQNAWQLNGNNTTPGVEFIGTLGPDDMRFWTDGSQKMILTMNGDLNLGSNTALGSSNLVAGAGNNVDSPSGSNMVSGWSNNVQNSGAMVVGGQSNTTNNATKGVALGWANTIGNHNQYLIGAANSATQEYSGIFGVGLNVAARGAWYLGGNSGTTLTNNITNSLAIGWANQHTALFDQNGLALATPTLTNATARLDVFAPPFLGGAGNNIPSGVRFQQLPSDTGNIMVIRGDGYVFDSGIDIANVSAGIGDNLGNHCATQPLDMKCHPIENVAPHIMYCNGNGILMGGPELFTIGQFSVGGPLPPAPPVTPPFTNYMFGVNGDAFIDGQFFASSDRRYKKDINPINNAIDIVTQLKGVSYEYDIEGNPNKNFSAGTTYGFIAQELEEVIPDVTRKDGDGYYAVNYIAIIPILAQAITEQQAVITELQGQLDKLNTGQGVAGKSTSPETILVQSTPDQK